MSNIGNCDFKIHLYPVKQFGESRGILAWDCFLDVSVTQIFLSCSPSLKTSCFHFEQSNPKPGERGGSVVECQTPEREVGGSKPTAAVLCPWARHFTPWKYW